MLRAVLLVATGVFTSSSAVHAQPSASPPASPKEPLLHIGLEGGYTPLGGIGLAVELHPLPWLVVAGGLGGHPNDSWTGHYDLQLALSSRFRLLSRGDTSLSAGLGLSRGDRPIERLGSTVMVWRERVGAIRLNPELSLAHRFGRRWTVRGFVGLGIVVTEPSACYWFNPGQMSCSSPPVPPPYDQVKVPLLPYAGFGVAANLDKESPGVGPTWYGWQIFLVDVAALVATFAGSDSSTVGTGDHLLFYGGLGLWTLGGPIIHLEQKKRSTAALSFALRILAPLAALVLEAQRAEPNRFYPATMATMGGVALLDWTALSWRTP